MRPASIWNLISSSASAAACGSSAEVGSSSSSTRGSSAIARTSPSRWRSPVDSSAIGRSSRAGSSAERGKQPIELGGRRESARARSRPTRPARPRHSARGAATPGPASRGAPRLRGRRSPRPASRSAMARSSRVLPEPDGPSTARHSCAAHLEGERQAARAPTDSRSSARQPSTASARARPLARARRPRQRQWRAGPASNPELSTASSGRCGSGPGRRRSNPLAVDLALELLDGLLGARPVGVHVEQLPERLERRLLLADLAQDLGKAVERLEMIGVERQRAPAGRPARARYPCARSARRRGGSRPRCSRAPDRPRESSSFSARSTFFSDMALIERSISTSMVALPECSHTRSMASVMALAVSSSSAVARSA